jgi:hypothetical protein
MVGTVIRIRTLVAAVACGVVLLAVGSATGDAASPPAVTNAASMVTNSSAQLNGVISPGGLPTYWEFQWGTTKSYGHNTSPKGPLTGTGAVHVSAAITGLRPGTTYYFRLVAIQGAGGASGEPIQYGGNNETLKTSGAKPRVRKHAGRA